MSRLSPSQIGAVWLRNGGAAAHIVVAVAVCIAESGGDTDVVSPSLDYGLWQINQRNLAPQGLTTVTARDPDRNAQVAIRMSGNGTNWGAWCTCYTHPEGQCGSLYLPLPQPNSYAANNLGYAAQALNESPPDLGPTPDISTESGVTYAWQYWRDVIGKFSRDTFNSMTDTINAVRRL